MFLQKFSSEQQSALLYLAHRVIHVDDDFDDGELDRLDSLNKQVNHGVLTTSFTNEQIAKLFDTTQLQSMLLTELLLVSFSDGQLHPSETKLIQEYLNLFNYSEEDFAELFQATHNFAQYRYKLESFIAQQ